jgi:hypothetical protein
MLPPLLLLGPASPACSKSPWLPWPLSVSLTMLPALLPEEPASAACILLLCFALCSAVAAAAAA